MPSAELTLPATPTGWWVRLLRLMMDVVSARRAGSLWTHCLLAWPMALLPSYAFSVLSKALLRLMGIDPTQFRPPSRVEQFMGNPVPLIVVAPLVETMVLGGLLWLLCKLSRRPLFVAAASGVLWGCLHGVSHLVLFFGTFWGFYVFSCSYMAWRPKGFGHAYAAAALPHAMHNLTIYVLVYGLLALDSFISAAS